MSGSESGSRKPVSRKAGRAPRSDFYTYIRTGEGWLYLASVIDIGSRRFLGYSMSSRMKASLVVDALDMAAGVRGGNTEGIIFHHDRGGQYMGDDMAKAAKRYRIKQSAGRTGCVWAQAPWITRWRSRYGRR